jgi:hypothetical protein
MAGVAQRSKIPGPASLLKTRKTRFQQTRRLKNDDCRRTRLQIDCGLFGLEGNQGHIKLLHFLHVGLRPRKKSPGSFIPRGVRFLSGTNSAADCLRHLAGVQAGFVVRVVAAVQRCLLHSHDLSVAAQSQPVFFLHGLSASSPSILAASVAFAAWPPQLLEEHFH